MLGLLLGGNGVDLFAGLDEAAVVLLLDLGADIVEGHEGRGPFEVIVHLRIHGLASRSPFSMVSFEGWG